MDIFIGISGLLAYIIGALPTGYIIAKLKGINDIRAHGSGNIGATNVSRFLGKHYFFLIFFLDAGKAYIYMYLIKEYVDFNQLCILASILLFGNGCSLFLQGSGGKGVATLCGLLASLYPATLLPLFLGWLFILFITHTVGIASVVAVMLLPVYAYTTDNNAFFLFALFATVWIIHTHRSNIKLYWQKH
jgi:glycerol-3-phosphate acyltransferase PlsY